MSNDSDTILIVDDIEANVDTLVRILDEYDLIPVTSGADALAVLETEKVDLVLLDIVMPDLDGYEVCRRIKANPGKQDLPIIFITAMDDARSIETAYAAGGYDYVTKPFKTPELLARVKTQLTLSRQYRMLRQQNLELTRMESALVESEERYRLAMNASRDGLWDWDVQSGKIFFNKGWADIIAVDEVDGDYNYWIERLHPDDHDRVIESLNKHLQGNGEQYWYEEHRLRRGDDNWIWVAGRGQVTDRDEQGKATRMIGTMIDISQRKQKEQLNQLRHRLSDMGYQHELDELMRVALDEAETMTDSSAGFYHLIDENQDRISLRVWSTHTIEEMCSVSDHELHTSISKAGVWADCVRQGRPLIYNDYDSLSNKKGMPAGHPDTPRLITIPVSRDGRIVSVMGVSGKATNYDNRDQDILTAVAEMAQDFFDRRRFEKRIEFMAFNDSLTGLPNRELLMDRMRQAISMSQRSDQLIAICYLDLDGFKPVNDSYGHHVGDALLVQMGRRLSKELRDGDTLARLGGDEFVIVLSALESIADGESIIKRILDLIQTPFYIEEHCLSVSASIGITFYPNDESEPDALLRNADQAMYQVKQNQKSGYRMYDPVFSDKTENERKLFQEMQSALNRGELELYYQPRINLGTGEVVSAEALLRWNHPDKGILTPSSFLPLLASTSLEPRLTEWVLETALDQHQRWKNNHLHLPVSVNISSRYIRTEGFTLFLKRLLEKYPKATASEIELDIVDINTLRKPDEIADAMQQVGRLGLHFSLDDFDSGYESLSYFQLLPINVLKIDRVYVDRMFDNETNLDVVEGMIRLAHNLKRPAVAEGVASLETGMILLQLGCQFAQGYSIAKPMPAHSVSDWMVNWETENTWHELNQEVQHAPEKYDLNVSIFSHRRWLEQIVKHIENGVNQSDLSSLDSRHCQFERWYRGLGSIRYGKHPAYPLIAAAHQTVHDIASKLISAADQAKHKSPPDLLELRTASDHLIELLKRLN